MQCARECIRERLMATAHRKPRQPRYERRWPALCTPQIEDRVVRAFNSSIPSSCTFIPKKCNIRDQNWSNLKYSLWNSITISFNVGIMLHLFLFYFLFIFGISKNMKYILRDSHKRTHIYLLKNKFKGNCKSIIK